MNEAKNEAIVVHVDPELEELIPGFLANRRRDVASLRLLLEQRDYAAIRMIGHSMKGAGGGYGFDLITEYGDQIEVAALEGRDDTILSVTSALADYLARVKPVSG